MVRRVAQAALGHPGNPGSIRRGRRSRRESCRGLRPPACGPPQSRLEVEQLQTFRECSILVVEAAFIAAMMDDRNEGSAMPYRIDDRLPDGLRDVESAKITCGKSHFEALKVGESPAEYIVARTVDDVLVEVSGD